MTPCPQTEYGMQQAKMQDLTTTILCPGKWEEPGGLRFHIEVSRASASFVLEHTSDGGGWIQGS